MLLLSHEATFYPPLDGIIVHRKGTRNIKFASAHM